MDQVQVQVQVQNQDRSVRKFQTDTGEVKLSPAIIKQYLVNGNGAISDQEALMFLKLCEGQKLNPFIKEAYLIKYGNNTPATMVVSKDVFMKRAAKHQDFNGLESGVIVSKQGEIEYKQGAFYNSQTEQIVGAWAKVHRKSWALPIIAEVNFDEYVGKKKDFKTGEEVVNGQWASKPATMITKVAETQALRKAFVEDLQGMYDESEMNVTIEQQDLITIPEQRVIENPLVVNGMVVGEKSPERIQDEQNDFIEAELEKEAQRQNGEKPPF